MAGASDGLGGDRHVSRAWVLGTLLGWTFLARLDAVFLVAAYLAWYVMKVRRWQSVVNLLLAVAIWTVPYVAANWYFFGSIEPVSGWMKSSFPEIYIAHKTLVWNGFSRTALWGYNLALGWIPILLSLGMAAMARNTLRSARDLLAVFALGGLGQCLYVSLFARAFTAWLWYYVLPMMLIGLVGAVIWNEITALFRWNSESTLARYGSIAVGVLAIVFFVAKRAAQKAIGQHRFCRSTSNTSLTHSRPAESSAARFWLAIIRGIRPFDRQIISLPPTCSPAIAS